MPKWEKNLMIWFQNRGWGSEPQGTSGSAPVSDLPLPRMFKLRGVNFSCGSRGSCRPLLPACQSLDTAVRLKSFIISLLFDPALFRFRAFVSYLVWQHVCECPSLCRELDPIIAVKGSTNKLFVSSVVTKSKQTVKNLDAQLTLEFHKKSDQKRIAQF